MENLPVTIKCRVNEYGDLQPDTNVDQARKDMFKKALKIGDVVEVTYQVYNPDYSIAQLDKVHKLIRCLAAETGEEFSIMKLHIKQKAGLGDKSFADCTKEEISEAIKTAISIGDLIGCNLHSF